MAKKHSTAAHEIKPKKHHAAFEDLPFVYQPKRGFKGSSNWHVPPTDNFNEATNKGMEYAAHFVQYLKDNPGVVGMPLLGSVARCIDFESKGGANGYWVGFFAYLERLIHYGASRIDVFDDVDKLTANYAEREAELGRQSEEVAS